LNIIINSELIIIDSENYSVTQLISLARENMKLAALSNPYEEAIKGVDGVFQVYRV
jgi:hypothetical protein